MTSDNKLTSKISPHVSIIIPVYNTELFIVEAIKSVQEQTFKDWDLIVIDDGSSDNTADLVSTFLSDSRIKYYKQENSGPAVARNTGLLLTSGELVAFLDADDYWHPTKLEKQVQVFQNHPDVDICGVQADIVDLSRTIISEKPHPDGFYYGNGFPRIFFTTLANMTTGVFRRTIFDKHGCFDVNCKLAEDYELFLRLARDAVFYVIPEILAYIRKGGNITSISYTQGDIRREYALNNIIPQFLTEHGGSDHVKWYHVRKLRGLCYKNRADEKGTYREALYWYVRALTCNPFYFETWAGLACRTLPGSIFRTLKKYFG